MTSPKIGLLDIETAPIEGSVWGLFKQNISVEKIAVEWSVLSYCWKPLGGRRASVVYEDTSSKEDPRDDFDLVRGLWHLLSEADMVIAHNGRRFDLRKIKARMMMHALPPPRPVRVIDTLELSRNAGAFTSHKLAWLSKYFARNEKIMHGQFAGFTLWKECLAGNPKAWAEMRKYNIRDVISMEEVYMHLRPWSSGHPNVAIYSDSEEKLCPVCGGSKLHRQDRDYFTDVSQYELYQCAKCKAWSRSRYTINTKGKRKALLTPTGSSR